MSLDHLLKGRAVRFRGFPLFTGDHGGRSENLLKFSQNRTNIRLCIYEKLLGRKMRKESILMPQKMKVARSYGGMHLDTGDEPYEIMSNTKIFVPKIHT